MAKIGKILRMHQVWEGSGRRDRSLRTLVHSSFRVPGFLLGIVGLVLFMGSSAWGGVILFSTPSTGVITVKAKSYKEIKFRDVVKQQYDFSCGSAAVATLLTYSYLRPISENQAFVWMYKTGDKAKIRKEGFSLLDIKRFLASLGYQADGYRVPLRYLAQVKVPAIVLIETNGYMHFVVIKGIENDHVLLGDPAMGLRMETLKDFKKIWQNGIVFVIHRGPNILVSQKTFNNNEDWSVVNIGIPFNVVQNNPNMANQLLLVPGPNQYQFGGFARVGIP